MTIGVHSRGTSTVRINSLSSSSTLLPFDFGFGREDHAMPQGGQGDLHHVVGHGVVAAIESRQRASALHQRQSRPAATPPGGIAAIRGCGARAC